MTGESSTPIRRDIRRLAIFALIYVALAAYWSLRRELWYDELFVAWIAEQPSFAAVWTALAAGADNHPPLYYLLAHVTSGSDAGLRAPSIIAMLGALLCVFFSARRLSGAAAGWLSVGLLLSSEAALWAVQARSYSLTVLFAAASLLAWQMRRHSIVAASLALGMWSGWYCVLLPLPLMAGQWLRDRRDARAWASLLLPWLAVLPLLPLATAATDFKAGFWATPKITKLMTAHGELFGYVPAVLALGIAALMLVGRHAAAEDESGADRAELAAACCAALLPVAVYLLAVLATNAFHARAALIALPGMAVAAGALMARRARVLAPVALCVGAFHFAAMPLEFPHQNVRAILRAYEIATTGATDVPVLLDGELSLSVQRYRDRATALVVGDDGNDHVALALERLSKFAPLTLSRGEHKFRLVTWKSETLERLSQQGYVSRFVARHGNFSVYDCERPETRHPGGQYNTERGNH